MKARFLLLAALLAVVSCGKGDENGGGNGGGNNNGPKYNVDDPITVETPTPKTEISEVTLDALGQALVRGGNEFAFKLLPALCDGKSMVVSPLSLELALAMTANGAKGQTQNEMLTALGFYPCSLEPLNAWAKNLLEKLPAVDLDVTLKLVDAILLSDRYTYRPEFKTAVETNYYAAAEYMSFEDPQKVLDRVNEWAYRNTGGLIEKMLDGLSEDAMMLLMNSLYFKAKWQGTKQEPMFNSDYTTDKDFFLDGGGAIKVPMMPTSGYFPYAKLDGYRIVGLPYSKGKFFFYVLLPDEKGGDGLSKLLKKLPSESWSEILPTLTTTTNVLMNLPKFEASGDYLLNDALKSLGMKQAFDDKQADFSGMLSDFDTNPLLKIVIARVLQKSKIRVAEWGTEAAAVTVVEMYDATAMPIEDQVVFNADHPFVFLIGEKSSGTILFEGVYSGK